MSWVFKAGDEPVAQFSRVEDALTFAMVFGCPDGESIWWCGTCVWDSTKDFVPTLGSPKMLFDDLVEQCLERRHSAFKGQ